MAKYYDRRKYKPRKSAYGRYKPSRRGKKSPFLAVLIIFIVCGGCALGGFYYWKSKKEEKKPHQVVENTPMPTEHPLENTDIDDLQYDVGVNDTSFKWFSDSYVYDGTLMFCAGQIAGNDAKMTSLMSLSTGDNASHNAQRVNITLENDHFMYPVFNGNWLVYLDAKVGGGGKICCFKYGSTYSESEKTVVKDVYTGYPALFLSGDYLTWTERTGTNMDKLFACDLRTLESVTVQKFDRAAYGVSKPSIRNNQLVWSDVDTENSTGGITSQICVLDMKSGSYISYKPGMFAHDPKTNGKGAIAWMNGSHGPDADLYISYDNGNPERIAEGIVDFYMDENFLAYQKDEAIFVYIFSTKKEYRITRNVESAQILGASDGCVVWCDISSSEREILRFAKIPR